MNNNGQNNQNGDGQQECECEEITWNYGQPVLCGGFWVTSGDVMEPPVDWSQKNQPGCYTMNESGLPIEPRLGFPEENCSKNGGVWFSPTFPTDNTKGGTSGAEVMLGVFVGILAFALLGVGGWLCWKTQNGTSLSEMWKSSSYRTLPTTRANGQPAAPSNTSAVSARAPLRGKPLRQASNDYRTIHSGASASAQPRLGASAEPSSTATFNANLEPPAPSLKQLHGEMSSPQFLIRSRSVSPIPSFQNFASASYRSIDPAVPQHSQV